MEWEYERTTVEFEDELCEHFGCYSEDYVDIERREKILDENACYDWEGGKRVANVDWCPRCLMFAEGLKWCPLVLEQLEHWRYCDSKWHFSGMYPGNSHSDFCNRFASERMYSEIEASDVILMESKLAALGMAYRTCDRGAVEETKRAIEFCWRWLGKAKVIYECS